MSVERFFCFGWSFHSREKRWGSAISLRQLCHYVSLPGHTTHLLQPMEVSLFRPLSSYYIGEIEKWLWAKPGYCITQAKVAVLFDNAYRKACTVATAVSVFWSVGIWSVNRDEYQNHHFFPSLVNTHGTDFDQPVQAMLQDKAGTSQASSQRIRNGNTSLLVPAKYHLFQNLILPAVLRRNTGPKCLRRQLN